MSKKYLTLVTKRGEEQTRPRCHKLHMDTISKSFEQLLAYSDYSVARSSPEEGGILKEILNWEAPPGGPTSYPFIYNF